MYAVIKFDASGLLMVVKYQSLSPPILKDGCLKRFYRIIPEGKRRSVECLFTGDEFQCQRRLGEIIEDAETSAEMRGTNIVRRFTQQTQTDEQVPTPILHPDIPWEDVLPPEDHRITPHVFTTAEITGIEDIHEEELHCVKPVEATEICNVVFDNQTFHSSPLQEPAVTEAEHTGLEDDDSNASYCENQRQPELLEEDRQSSSDCDLGELVGPTKRGKKRKPTDVFCPYCKKTVSHFPRHLLTKHPEEEAVVQLATLPSKSKDRGKLLRAIRGSGMHVFNTTQAQNEIKVARAGSSNIEVVPCPKCHTYMQKNNVARHLTTTCQDAEKKSSVGCVAIAEGRQTLLKDDKVVDSQGKMIGFTDSETKPSKLLKSVISSMRKDRIFDTIMKDDFLINWGNAISDEHATQPSMGKSISYSLRALANLFTNMKTKSPSLNCVPNIFHPDQWECMIETIKEDGGWDEENRTYRKPTHAINVGNVLTLCLKYLPSYYVLQKTYEEHKDSYDQFMVVFNSQYHKRVKKPAISLTKQAKWEKRTDLPSTNDVQKLNSYIKRKALECCESLEKEFNVDAWIKLNEVLMIELILFNRKRPGEVERMTIDDFGRKRHIQKDTEIYDSLPPHLKIMAERFFHVVIRGKLTRGVSILIPNDVSAKIDVLLKNRNNVAVTATNNLLFARGNTHFRVYNAICDAASRCGADYPERLTATQLRKHLASTCQALNMTDADIEKLASFMGHTSKTHRSIYRLPDTVTEVTQLATLLLALEEGKSSSIRRMTVEEVTETFHDITPSMTNEDVESFIDNIDKYSQPEEMEHPLPQNDPEMSEDNIVPKRKRAPLLQSSDSEDNSSSEEIRTPKKVSGRGGCAKRTWSTPEKKCVRNSFERYLSGSCGLPSEKDCADLIRQYPVTLKGRTSKQLKAWVNNQILKFKKKK